MISRCGQADRVTLQIWCVCNNMYRGDNVSGQRMVFQRWMGSVCQPRVCQGHLKWLTLVTVWEPAGGDRVLESTFNLFYISFTSVPVNSFLLRHLYRWPIRHWTMLQTRTVPSVGTRQTSRCALCHPEVFCWTDTQCLFHWIYKYNSYRLSLSRQQDKHDITKYNWLKLSSKESWNCKMMLRQVSYSNRDDLFDSEWWF